MSYKKKYLIILFVLFMFASSKEVTASINTECQDAFVSAISEDNSTDAEHITMLKGILECSLKMNENNVPSFRNFKDNKKNIVNQSFRSTLYLKSFYSVYIHTRINSVSVSPFYINYSRLTI